MYLPISAQGVNLTAEQAKILDDEFYLSNPFDHFASRITMLLETSTSEYKATPSNQPKFFEALGLVDAELALDFDLQNRSVQVAADSISLRHQAAEALARFIYARVAAKPRNGDATSTWLAVADSPTRMVDVLKANRGAFDADSSCLPRLLFPASTIVGGRTEQAMETATAWINHAVWLLTNTVLPINTANNKLKHGLAISARGDVRIELLREPPKKDGTIPVSAFGNGKSIPLFDRPLLTYLSRQPKEFRQGLEAIFLRVDVPVVLAETWMLANVYAAMFHVAAREHFGEDLPAGVAPYPSLVLGRLPKHVVGERPLGYRTAVTLPPDGMTPPRDSGLAFYEQFLPLKIDLDSMENGIVVDG